MFAILVAVALLVVAVLGVYWLLKSMGEDGVEAAAPGSCKSGRCGVPPKPGAAPDTPAVSEQYVSIDEIRRKDARSDNQTL